MILAAMIAVILATPVVPECPAPTAAMLSLPLHDFDQTDAGWRSLATPGCDATAADAIARYRADNTVRLEAQDTGTLDWHEGQMRASAGQTEAAIAIMERKLETAHASVRPYTEATIAFLRRDRAGLEAAQSRLLALPEPEEFTRAKERYEATYPNLPPLVWPLNADIVAGLLACFDRPYGEAYACDAKGEVQP